MLAIDFSNQVLVGPQLSFSGGGGGGNKALASLISLNCWLSIICHAPSPSDNIRSNSTHLPALFP